MAYRRKPLYQFKDQTEVGIDVVPNNKLIFIEEGANSGLYLKSNNTGLLPTSTVQTALTGNNIVSLNTFESMDGTLWDAGTTYAEGDKVVWNGYIWIATTYTESGVPNGVNLNKEPGEIPDWILDNKQFDTPIHDLYYWADEHIDRVIGINAETLLAENIVMLDPSKDYVKAGSCDRAGYTDRMFVRTPKLNGSYPDPALNDSWLQMVDLATQKWYKNIPVTNPPRSSGGYNKYRDLQGITGKTRPIGMLVDVSCEKEVGVANQIPQWDNGTSYNIGDIIEYDYTLYVALTAGAGNQPDSSPANWEAKSPDGNDGGNASGHFIWLDADHFAVLDRYRDVINAFRINETYPPYTMTLVDSISNLPTSCHSFITKSGAAHLFEERVFFAGIEGSSASKDNTNPSIGKFIWDTTSESFTQINCGGVNGYFEVVSSLGVDDRLHHFGIAHDGQLLIIPLENSGEVYLLDAGVADTDPITAYAAHPGAIFAGAGAGHAEVSNELNKTIITNHKDTFITIIDLNDYSKVNVSFPCTVATGAGFIQSHRNWVINNGTEYIFANAPDGVIHKIDLVTDTLVGTQKVGGFPVQTTS